MATAFRPVAHGFQQGPVKAGGAEREKWAYAHFLFGSEKSERALNRKELDIEALLTPAVEALDCELWGVEYMSQGRHSKLRLYIERPDGVSIEDCERVSREASDLLDVEDLVSESYTLEVSSPGMDRILFKPAHFASSVGQQVDVRLHFPFEGRKRFVGLLAGFEDEEAVVRVEDEEYLLPIENILRARLVPQFD